ncbi:MAG: hypothetical protein BWK76_16940 [Desulfobulbaceae bacterium A2]|nr:MAG: hypothetical protein BWK76_16940 [Desulfobulbaceae bacterium A2]
MPLTKTTIVIDPAGLARLRGPLLPLARMVHFFLATGAAKSAAAVLAELPERIETVHAVYEEPARLLAPYLPLLDELTRGQKAAAVVVAEDGTPLDAATARTALLWQRLLEDELEKINSLLCAPCDCTLCCTGPGPEMAQDFFFIPLQDEECRLFALPRLDTPASRRCDDLEALPALLNTLPEAMAPVLLRWRQGWLLSLPRGSGCPQLRAGRCLCYEERPRVCRRPQIFPYLLEAQTGEGTGASGRYRLRHGLRAVSDCPYVAALRDDIATYAAACELTLYFGPNKG